MDSCGATRNCANTDISSAYHSINYRLTLRFPNIHLLSIQFSSILHSIRFHSVRYGSFHLNSYFSPCLNIPIVPPDAATRAVDWSVPSSFHLWGSFGSTDARANSSCRSFLPALGTFPASYTPAVLFPPTTEEINYSFFLSYPMIAIGSDPIHSRLSGFEPNKCNPDTIPT
jgi:hypothetical protein